MKCSFNLFSFITAFIFFCLEVDNPFLSISFCSLISLPYYNDIIISLCWVWICHSIFQTTLHFCIFLIPHLASVQICGPHSLSSSVLLDPLVFFYMVIIGHENVLYFHFKVAHFMVLICSFPVKCWLFQSWVFHCLSLLTRLCASLDFPVKCWLFQSWVFHCWPDCVLSVCHYWWLGGFNDCLHYGLCYALLTDSLQFLLRLTYVSLLVFIFLVSLSVRLPFFYFWHHVMYSHWRMITPLVA